VQQEILVALAGQGPRIAVDRVQTPRDARCLRRRERGRVNDELEIV
jgi:hypothetical protein